MATWRGIGPGPGPFLMIPFLGLKELIVITGVVLALYGRGGARLLKGTRYGRSIDPWLNLVRVRPRTRPGGARPRFEPEPAPPTRSGQGQGRVFWALVLIAAAIAAAWIATRMTVLGGGSGGVP